VTEGRRGNKVERQQRAYFEANRKPVMQRRLPDPAPTRVAPVSSDESLLAVAPRQRSLDLLMLAGPPVLPPTKKRELSSNDAFVLKANELESTSSPQQVKGERRLQKRPRKDLEEVAPAKPGSCPFKVPVPRLKPNFYLSNVSQPLHKGTLRFRKFAAGAYLCASSVRFFDEGTERTDEEYLRDEQQSAPVPRLTERWQPRGESPLSAPLPTQCHDSRASFRFPASGHSLFIDAELEPMEGYAAQRYKE
jgi:hypothetical protein